MKIYRSTNGARLRLVDNLLINKENVKELKKKCKRPFIERKFQALPGRELYG